MVLKYGANINNESIVNNLKKLINQTYKLLPIREEGADWLLPLSTITEEVAGMDEMLIGEHNLLFPLLCKLEGLNSLDREEDFSFYRRTIFECLSLYNSIISDVQSH